MADTFSLNAPAPVLTQDQGGPAAANVSSASAGPMQAPQVPAGDPAADRTMQALTKMGREILAPHIKQAQQEQFLQGVQRAAAGEAVKDIVDQQPWYMNIFGPSSASQGARAYEVANRVARFGAEMEQQMPKLREQGPEALQGAVTGLLKELETGDALADTAIMSQVVDQMAPLYKRHAKEHYAWTQFKAKDNQRKMFGSAFAAYQERAKAAASGLGSVTPEDLKAERGRMLGSMNPFADQSEESYQEVMEGALSDAIRSGNFHAVKALQEEGVFAALPAESQARLRGQMGTAGRAALAKIVPDMAVEMSMITQDMAQNPAGVAKRVAELNAKAAALSGVDTEFAQLIPTGSVDNIVGRVMSHRATAAAKQAELALGQSMAAQALKDPNGFGPYIHTGLVKRTDVETAAVAQWQTLNPVQRATFLNQQASETISSLKDYLSGTLNTEKDNPGVQATVATFRGMDDSTRGRYFSDDQVKFLARYDAYLQGGSPPEAAFMAAKVAAPAANTVLDPSEKAGAAKAIRDWAEKTNETRYGRNTVDDQSLRIIEAVIGRELKNRGPLSLDASVGTALGRATSQGVVQLLGKHAILSEGYASGQVPLTQLLGQNRGAGPVAPQAAADTFEAIFKEKAKAVGADTDDYMLMRLKDEKGEARFLASVMLKNPDGSLREQVIPITSEEIRARAAQKLEEALPENVERRMREERERVLRNPAAGRGYTTMMGAGPGALSRP